MDSILGGQSRGDIRFFSLARYALVEALKVLGISQGQKVLVPAFICRDLLASVHAVQGEPLFYSVDQSLAPLLLPVARDVKAVLAVNYFGFPQVLEPFRAYCTEHDAALIEDNAHGFLSRDEQGAPLGRRSDLGIVSLRKTFALPDGAALLVNRQDWVGRLPAPLPCRDDPLPASYIAKYTLRQIQKATGFRVLSLAEQVTRYLRRLRTGHALPVSLPESEYRIPGNPAIHCASLSMLKKVDATSEVKRRRTLYREFHRDLRHLNIEPIFPDLQSCVVPYGYPFRAKESDAAGVARIAHRRGFDCFQWPDLPAVVLPGAPESYRNVWWINF